MRLPEEPESPIEINIVPMIDVIFAVLIFFIVSSLFLAPAEELPIDLPAAGTGVPQSQTPIQVVIDREGNVTVASQPVGLDELAAVVAAQREIPGTVVIQADKQVPHGRVIAVMDVLRTLEGVQLAIATQPIP
ncbi:biopolymer transporter ExbD [filamentous cyanobacterium CCP5]|nr:biopolymer transporter ExbD [filamentous cyanobacterium CCP5]